MSLTKREQDALTQALANEELADKLLNEMQAMRNAFNALLLRLSLDPDLGDNTQTELAVENIRENGVNSKL